VRRDRIDGVKGAIAKQGPILFAAADEIEIPAHIRIDEKNWTLFGDAPFTPSMRFAPHRVLQFSLDGEEAIDFTEVVSTGVEQRCLMRVTMGAAGGAGPQRIGEHYYSILSLGASGAGRVPFMCRRSIVSPPPSVGPTDAPVRPLALPNPFGGSRRTRNSTRRS